MQKYIFLPSYSVYFSIYFHSGKVNAASKVLTANPNNEIQTCFTAQLLRLEAAIVKKHTVSNETILHIQYTTDNQINNKDEL